MKRMLSVLALLCFILFIISCGGKKSESNILITQKAPQQAATSAPQEGGSLNEGDADSASQDDTSYPDGEEDSQEAPVEAPAKDTKTRIKAEIKLSELYITPSSPIKGQESSLGMIVSNAGKEDIGSFDYMITIYDKDSVDDIKGVYNKKLPAGEQISIKLPYTFNKTGIYQIEVYLDSSNSFDESNKLDNFKKDSANVRLE